MQNKELRYKGNNDKYEYGSEKRLTREKNDYHHKKALKGIFVQVA